MAAMENNGQYELAVKRVESLLPLVNDEAPTNAPNSMRLGLFQINMVTDYSDKHFIIGRFHL